MDPSSNNKVLLIHKPYQWTSFDVVNKLRYLLKIKKIGHAGTLDPLATGLLIICTGNKTKEIEHFMGLEKEYTGTLVLGKATPSHDLETPITEVLDCSHILQEDILKAMATFLGDIDQVPPQHSAIKVNGKRAYALARTGKTQELKSRKVHIATMELLRFENPEVDFKIVCSKGTYIRSLVRDIGITLQVGAHLKSLCRTKIGTYSLEQAQTLDELKHSLQHEDLPRP